MSVASSTFGMNGITVPLFLTKMSLRSSSLVFSLSASLTDLSVHSASSTGWLESGSGISRSTVSERNGYRVAL